MSDSKKELTDQRKEEVLKQISDLFDELGWSVLIFSNEDLTVPAILGGTDEFVDGVKNSFAQADLIAQSMSMELDLENGTLESADEGGHQEIILKDDKETLH